MNPHPHQTSYPPNKNINSSEYQYLSRMSLPKSKTPSERSDPLQRLEVETTSTTSIPISFPYYYIDDRNNSFDTFNLLHAGSETQDPVYKNTTHIQPLPAKTASGQPETSMDPNQATIGGIPVKKGSSSPESISRLKEISNDAFNPVPKRFSQFITEQQQFSQRPPDELTSNTTSIGSDSDNTPINGRQRKSFSTMSTRMRGQGQGHSPSMSYAMRSSVGRKSNAGMRSNGASGQSVLEGNLVKQRSNSIRSQATIFSTRQEEQTLLQPVSSESSSLKRSKAIKSKQGSIFYRMKLRLKKLLKKLRISRFRRTASSKRTGNSIRVKSRTIRRKQRENPKNQSIRKLMKISAPVNNPHLGQGKVHKVTTLDDDLKYEAGAPKENVNVNEDRNLKMNHLSHYIDQQQGLYLNNMNKKANSINYGTSPELQYKNKELYDQIEEVPVSESSSVPPPVPKHGDVQGQAAGLGNYDDMVQLWRNYLIFVVLKRIQLRQEISYFQQLLVGQDMKFGKSSVSSAYSMYDIEEGLQEASETEGEDEGYASDTISESSTRSGVSDSGTLSESMGSESLVSDSLASSRTEDQVQAYTTDKTTEKFNKKYNRQSVLSEMLDYHSDGEDSDSTITSASNSSVKSSTRQNSIRQPSLAEDLGIAKQYSIKQKKLTRSLSSMSSNNRTTSPMKRSTGYQVGLNLVQ